LTELGNPGWNAKELTPYLEAVENFNVPSKAEQLLGATFDASSHGKGGPINVSFSTPLRIPSLVARYKTAFSKVFSGIPVLKDLSSRTGAVVANTVWDIKFNAKTGVNQRSSAAQGFLYNQNNIKAGKLTVLTNTRVAKVITDAKNKATGMEIRSEKGGKGIELRGTKEIILAAGSLQTPAILERSGFGPSDVLKKLGITQKLELSGVGKNLVDQPGTLLGASLATQFVNQSGFVDAGLIFAPIISLTSIDQLFGSSAAKTLKKELIASIPKKAQAAVKAGALPNVAGATALYNALSKLITTEKQPIAEFIGESALPNSLQQIFWPSMPFSRGTCHAVSTDPFDDPAITPRFLTDEFDQKVVVQIMKQALKVYQSSAMSTLIDSFFVEGLGVPLNQFNNDTALLDYVQGSAFGASHWLGSSAMLPKEMGGVVGPDLKPYGTNRLRIVDASILPLEITSHTMPMVYATSLKAADIILGKQ
ncbi:GMC oxidoreductase, partial [Atractiella rhizophila]